MKNMNKIAVLAVLGASLGTTAFGQFDGPGRNFGPPGDHRGGSMTNHPPPLTAAQRVGQLATNYASLASYDANHDGQLDSTEQAAVAQALVNGKLQPPGPPRGPEGGTPPTPTAEMAQHIAAQMATVYAAIAPYDVNHDGQLDETEQAAVTTAMQNGTLRLPMMRGPGGGMRGHQGGGPDGFGQPPGNPPPTDR